MPQNVKLTGMDKAGISRDTPSIILPHNQLSDALNVRFRNNTINKMRGEENVLGGAFTVNTITSNNENAFQENISLSNLHYWPNPRLVGDSSGFYITGTAERQYLIRPEINRAGTSRIPPRLVNPRDSVDMDGFAQGITFFDSLGRWDTDTFTGGFALIHNNGINTPQFMLDGGNDESLVLRDLPGWNYQNSVAAGSARTGYDVSAGIVRSFGNVLIAGNLSRTVQTYDSTRTYVQDETVYVGTATLGTVFRARRAVAAGNANAPAADGTQNTNWEPTDIQRVTNLTGTIRVSDAAAPGTVPQTWDPFRNGTDFAEERELTDTSQVRNIVPLQGQAIIYTSDSIHSLSLGVNNIITAQVAQGWGTLNNTSVVEFDGKHFVVDVDDIYLFAGHPGNIQSVADARVRDYLYSNLHPVSTNNTHVVLNKSQDEIWVNFPNRQSISGFCNEALIWNYRSNTWTRRDLNDVVASTDGPVTGGGLPEQQFTFDGSTGQTRQFAGNAEVQTITIDNDAFTTPGDEPLGFDLDFDGNTGAIDYAPPPISGQADSFTRSAENVRRVLEESSGRDTFSTTDAATLFEQPDSSDTNFLGTRATLQSQAVIETFSEDVTDNAEANQISTSNLTVDPVLVENTDTDFLVTDTISKTITSDFSGSGTSYSPRDLNPDDATGISVSSNSLTVRPIVNYSSVDAGTVTQYHHSDGNSNSLTYTETVTTNIPVTGSITIPRTVGGSLNAEIGNRGQPIQRGAALPATAESGDTISTAAFTTMAAIEGGSIIGGVTVRIFVCNVAGTQVGSELYRQGVAVGRELTTTNIPAQTFTLNSSHNGATHLCVRTVWGVIQFNTHGREDRGGYVYNEFGPVTSGQNGNRGTSRTFNHTLTAAGGVAQDNDTTPNAGQTLTVPSTGPNGGTTNRAGQTVTGNPSVVTSDTVTVPGIGALSNQDSTVILGTRTGTTVTAGGSGRFNFFRARTGDVNIFNNNRNARVEIAGSSTRSASVNTQSQTVYTITNSGDGETDFNFTPGALTRTGTTSITGNQYTYTVSPSGTTGILPLTGGPINNIPAGATVSVNAEFRATPGSALDTTTVISSNTQSSISGTRDLPGFTHTVMNPSGVPVDVTLTLDDGTQTIENIAPGATARFFDTTTTSRDNTINTITASRMLYDYDVTSAAGAPDLIATIRSTPTGSTSTTDVATADFIAAGTTQRLVVQSEQPTYTAFSREGRDLVDHHILTIENTGNQDFDLTMITHGESNTFSTGSIVFTPPTMAELIVPPHDGTNPGMRRLFATARVTSNTDVGRLEIGSGNDHTTEGIGRYTATPTTLLVGFQSNVDRFDLLPGVMHTFTGHQTASQAAAEYLTALLADTAFMPTANGGRGLFTAEISDADDSVIEVRVSSENRADFELPIITLQPNPVQVRRGDTALTVTPTEVQAPDAQAGASSIIEIDITGPAVPHVNTANNRVDIHADGFARDSRDLPVFSETIVLPFGVALADGSAIAANIMGRLNSNPLFPFEVTRTDNVLTLTSRATTDGNDALHPINRPYNTVAVRVTEAGISQLAATDFDEAGTTDGLTDEIHGAATTIQLTLTTDGMERTLNTFVLENTNNTDVAQQVFTALNMNASNDYVVRLLGGNTIDIRLADLTIETNQIFDVRVIDLDTGMPATPTTVATGSVSGMTRTSDPISTDNLFTIEASGNDEIFNNERPWPTDEFNDARTFVVMARPQANTLTAADIGFTFVNDDHNPTDETSPTTRNYQSYFERTQIDMSQVVDSMDTKHLKSFYIQSQAITGENDADFDVKVRATNTPADIPDLTIARDMDGNIDPSNNTQIAQAVDFNTADDYKSDVRITGRYISYRVEENGANGWSIPALEMEIDIAGRR